MNNNTTDDFQYNELAIKDARELLEELEYELYDLDTLLYDGIMGVNYAQGFSEIIKEDPTIDLSKTEAMIKKVRSDNSNSLKSLKNAINSVTSYLMLNSVDSGINHTDNKTKDINQEVKRINVSNNKGEDTLKKKVINEETKENQDEKEIALDNNPKEKSMQAKKISVEKKLIATDIKGNERITERGNVVISNKDKQVINLEYKPRPSNGKVEEIQPVYGSPVKPIVTNDDKPQIKPIPLQRPSKNLTKVTEHKLTPISGNKINKNIATLDKANIGKMSERLKGRDIPIVQPVYGSPVKPILTSDDKPQIKPIPIPKPGQGNTIGTVPIITKRNISKEMQQKAVLESQKRIMETTVVRKKYETK